MVIGSRPWACSQAVTLPRGSEMLPDWGVQDGLYPFHAASTATAPLSIQSLPTLWVKEA